MKTGRVRFKTIRVKAPKAVERKERTATSKKSPTTTPLRVDQALVNQARSAGALADRPATAQIEHWAKLGRVVDAVLTGESAGKLKQLSRVESLADIIAYSQSPEGRRKARAAILQSGVPTYGTHPDFPEAVVQFKADGTKTPGRFVNRQFVPSV